MSEQENAYEPELGQAVFHPDSYGEFSIPSYACALVLDILNEIGRVYWNRNQRIYEQGADLPKEMEGLVVRRYWWGDEDDPEACLPNLQFGGVDIRWYKRPGRGMSCNLEMSPDGWVQWYDSVQEVVRRADFPLDQSLQSKWFEVEG